MKRFALVLAGLVLAALVSFGTLLPASTSDSTAWHLHFDAADGVRNVVLFLPLGAVLAVIGIRPWRALLLCFAFTAGIETAQMWVPGRYPGPFDVLTNTLGGGLGIGLVGSAAVWLDPRASQQKWFQLLSGSAAALVLGISAALFQPVPPGSPYHCDHRPAVPGMLGWGGRVLSASLGDLSLPNAGFLETGRVEAELARESALELDLVRGKAPVEEAPIVVLVGDAHEEVWLVSEVFDELALRLGTRAQRLGFYGPLLRFDAVLADVRAGQRFEVRLRPAGSGATLELNGGPPVARGFTLGDGWRHYAGSGADLRERVLPDAAWLALLLVPLGFFCRASLSTAGALLIPVAALLTLPALRVISWSPATEWLGAVGGIAVGSALGWLLRRLGFAQDH